MSSVIMCASEARIEKIFKKFSDFKVKIEQDVFKFKTPLIWTNIIGIFILNILGVYAIVTFPYATKSHTTLVWGLFIGYASGMGVTAGAHRLWTHRTYKGKLPLRIFLMLCFSMSGQYSMVQWARDHRLHHKFSDTDADPHNANRGFFFSHCGWLMMKRHPESKKKGKCIDVSDIWADPVIAFHQKYFVPLFIVMFIIFPCAIPLLFFGDSYYETFMSLICFRYTIQLNSTWMVNSVAHFWGYKPYNINIKPVENRTVSLLTLGEGFHNYHHVFPFDYRAAEFGMEPNYTTSVLNICAWFGQAYDLKCASKDMVKKVIAKTGGDPHVEITEEDLRNL